MKRTDRPAQQIPRPRQITLPPKDYQPSKANMEEEIDMPGLSDKQVRKTFCRPFNVIRESK